ncbi:MAG: ATP-binding cassette domain-containing protein, partial [Gammaproteobacteria bacterium]|nr:ATP-binding cassette domain-containing protein [Gammaproteobacteria bacterium]
MSLILRNVETFYGNSQALFGLSMEVASGSVTTLLGRNGMGKTTTVNSIIGNIPIHTGEIFFNGEQVNGLPAYKIAQKGVGLAPEGRQIFPNLDVRENLIAVAANFGRGQDHWTLDTVLDLFPPLRERLNNMGNQLSGGEQQMLAIGRALMLNPELLILDEATEGLAPL